MFTTVKDSLYQIFVDLQYIVKAYVINLLKMASIEDLRSRVNALEEELDQYRKKAANSQRTRISEMSSEVVDSNPYRLT